MTIDHTTTALVAGIKRRGFIPAGSGLSATDILAYATDELESYIPALLKSIREEYLIASLDIAVSSGTVVAPERAVGAALRTISWVLTDDRDRPLPRIEPENAGCFTGQHGDPVGYMFEGNNIILLPAPTSGTLRLTYQQRPGVLVLPESCARVTSLNGGGGSDVTVTPAQTSWADDLLLDVVSAAPNFPALAIDATATGASTTALNFDGGQPTGLAIGDYVCLAGETCIPQIPTEVHGLLAQAAAHAIANATGSQRVATIKAKLDAVEAQTKVLLSPRSDGSARVVISRSRIGRWAAGW